MKYELHATKHFEKSAKKLPDEVLNHIEVKTYELKNNPRKGEPLRRELKGLWSLHTKFKKTEYRIIYSIDKKRRVVNFHYAGSRENLYKRVNRLKIKT